MPSNQSKAIDLEKFLDNHPLNFLLFYGDYEVINTVYLDDGSPLVDLSLELFNQSPNKVLFAAPPNDNEKLPASEDNCHFYLTLEGSFVLESPPEGWDVVVVEEKSIFYFLKNAAYELQPKAANDSTDKIVLTLKKFRAYPKGGTRTFRAELTYGPLLTDQNKQPFKDEVGQYFSYGNTIFITNNRGGKKTLPLQVGFAAGNAVLNDGTATNSLELLIANKNWPSSNLSLSQDSEFVISFEMGNQEGAVATDTQIKAIAISSISSNSNNWPVQHLPLSTEWTVKPKLGINQLASNEAIKLNITNLVTSNSSGAGYLYVRYKNIPNYPDGQFVVPIEKTPLLYRVGKIGIGTTAPAAKLHVNGGDAIVTGKVGIGITTPSVNAAPKIHLAIGDDDTGLNQEGDGKLAIYTNYIERVRIEGNDKNYGGAKLHVVGDLVLGTNADNKKFIIHSRTNSIGDFLQITYDKSDGDWDWDQGIILKKGGNVGIGTQIPSAKLHVSGDAIVSNKLAIGTTVSSHIHLTIGDNDTGLKQQEENKLAIYTNNEERVLIDESGKVGIGTQIPSAKLHVIGDAIVSNKLAIGTTVSSHIHLTIGDNDTGLKQEGDGKLAIYTNNIERVRIDNSGNVGIGTTTPSAKLDVNGSVRLGINSTIWSQMSCGYIYKSNGRWNIAGDGISYIKSPGPGKINVYPNFSIESNRTVILLTPQYLEADNLVTVSEIQIDHFVVTMKDTNKGVEDTNFYYLIINRC